jgi:hypothetical protein
MKQLTKNQEIIQTLTSLIQTENAHRGARVREELKNLNHESKSTPISPLSMPVLELYVILSNYGGSRTLLKKKSYLGRYHAKVWLDSPKTGGCCGIYRGKHSVHISANLVDSFSTVLHEITHYITHLLYDSDKPKPEKEWDDLRELFLSEVSKEDKDNEKFKEIFKDILTYEESLKTSELLPRFIEYLLIHQHLPTEKKAFLKALL